MLFGKAAATITTTIPLPVVYYATFTVNPYRVASEKRHVGDL